MSEGVNSSHQDLKVKRFKVGDKVKIKNPHHYGAGIPYKILYIYKNGDILLINPKTEDLSERWLPTDLKEGWN